MLSIKQNEITIGSLLGDGTIWNNFKGGPLKFQVTQSKLDKLGVDKKNYILWLVSEFMEFGCSVRPKNTKIKNGNKLYKSYVFNTRCTNFWNKLEKKWYVPIIHPYYKRRKIVPQDIKLTPLTLCVWFMDDGSTYPKDANATLETQGFTEEEVLFLIELLKNDLNIYSHIKWENRKDRHQPRIYIGKKSYFDLIETIKPHVEWDCFKYKLDTTTYNKIPQVGENHSMSKLKDDEVKEIFNLKLSGKQNKEIAEQFGISRSAISLILNGKRFKHLNLKTICKKGSKPLTEEQIAEIHKLGKQGICQSSIARKININQSRISRVLSGNTYSEVKIDA